jgi:hypothetical protein
MAAILWTSSHWLERSTWKRLVASGVVWGIAIGTKFTFAPLYLVFPIAMGVCRFMASHISVAPPGLEYELQPATEGCHPRQFIRGDSRAKIIPSVLRVVQSYARLAGGWICHATIATLALNALYLFQKPFVPIGRHDFISHEFKAFGLGSGEKAPLLYRTISMVPSPFPRLFLEGIDQQLADMRFPRGAYLNGVRIEGSLPWYFLVAFWIKEQPATIVSLAIGIIAVIASFFRRVPKNQVHGDGLSFSIPVFCWVMLSGMMLLFTIQDKLVWNMRYLIPAVPLLAVLAACSLELITSKVSGTRYGLVGKGLLILVASLVLLDISSKWKHPFSYTNAWFGGDRAVPMILNDSNFDYGQDVFYAQEWIAAHPGSKSILSGHGIAWIETNNSLPSIEDLRSAKANSEARHSNSRLDRPEVIAEPLVISRSLFHAEPWGVRYSDMQNASGPNEYSDALRALLQTQPALWITPTIVVYDSSTSTTASASTTPGP